FDKVFISLRKGIFVFICVNRYFIKCIFAHLLQLEPVHQSEVFEYLVEILTLIQSTQIMDPRIKQGLIPGISLQTTSNLFVFFNYANRIPLPCQYVTTYQP